MKEQSAAGIMDYKAVLAEHKASGQKMVVVDSGKKALLTQSDITADNAEDRIKQAIQKIKYHSEAVEEFKKAVNERRNERKKD